MSTNDILLTDAERERFLRYLRAERAQAQVMLEQLAKISAPEPIMRREKMRVAACTFLIDDFEKRETVTVGGSRDA